MFDVIDATEIETVTEDQLGHLVEILDAVAMQNHPKLRFEHISAWLCMCQPANS
jgi:hypothetical protein